MENVLDLVDANSLKAMRSLAVFSVQHLELVSDGFAVAAALDFCHEDCEQPSAVVLRSALFTACGRMADAVTVLASARDSGAGGIVEHMVYVSALRDLGDPAWSDELALLRARCFSAEQTSLVDRHFGGPEDDARTRLPWEGIGEAFQYGGVLRG